MIDQSEAAIPINRRLFIGCILLDPGQFPDREPPRPGSIVPDDPDGVQYTVEKLVDHRPARNPQQYLVRWEGYDESSDEWANKANIDRDLI